MTSRHKTASRNAHDPPVDGRNERLVVPVGRIEPNPRQPRRTFYAAEGNALADSIRRHGVLQPLLVMRSPLRPGQFMLVAGERRWRAARKAGLAEVPVTIIAADAQQRIELALVENVQRADLGPLERAHGYQTLIDNFGLTQARVADVVGISRSAVANTLRLQRLNAEMQQALTEGRITESHGRTLVGIADPAMRQRLFLQMLSGGVNSRQAERAARRGPAERHETDVELEHVAERLQGRLGARVRFVGTRKRGRIQIEYQDPEDLDVLLSMLLPD